MRVCVLRMQRMRTKCTCAFYVHTKYARYKQSIYLYRWHKCHGIFVWSERTRRPTPNQTEPIYAMWNQSSTLEKRLKRRGERWNTMRMRTSHIAYQSSGSSEFNERADYGHIHSVQRSINSDFNVQLQSTTFAFNTLMTNVLAQSLETVWSSFSLSFFPWFVYFDCERYRIKTTLYIAFWFVIGFYVIVIRLSIEILTKRILIFRSLKIIVSICTRPQIVSNV